MNDNSAQLLADLKWLLEERESFVCDKHLSHFLRPDWQQQFDLLRGAPNVLVEHMAAAKSHFLGTYFEQLFSFAVHRFTSLEVLAEHAQIQAVGKTLGEVDLLARDNAGRVWQFEIALKFYLERPDLFPNDWIGPNKNDSLKKKVDHAREHQLQILNRPEGKQWLSSFAVAEAVTANLMIFGRHFYSFASRDDRFFMSNESVHGWVRVSELLGLDDYLYDLNEAIKPNWITPHSDSSDKLKIISAELVQELQLRFDNDARPILFSCCNKMSANKNHIIWLFVCPDTW